MTGESCRLYVSTYIERLFQRKDLTNMSIRAKLRQTDRQTDRIILSFFAVKKNISMTYALCRQA